MGHQGTHKNLVLLIAEVTGSAGEAAGMQKRYICGSKSSEAPSVAPGHVEDLAGTRSKREVLLRK